MKSTLKAAAEETPEWLGRFRASLSVPGLLVGTLLFAFSLSPSLLPRGLVMQGLISGTSLAVGYAIGVSWRWAWGYLELPVPATRIQRIGLWTTGTICGAVAAVFLWQASEWQNSIRSLMELGPVDTARPWSVGAIALAVFLVLLGVARFFHFVFRLLARRLERQMPRRLANLIGLTLAVMLFWSAAEGLLFRQVTRSLDSSFQQLDARREAEQPAPESPIRTGSPSSLISWDEMGRTGRNYLAAVPSAAELSAFFEEVDRASEAPRTSETSQLSERPPAEAFTEVLDPIRVYVGLNAAESPAERAELALAELRRVGAFERSLLVLVTPTGTGWIDPAALTSLEYLHRGDVASVAVQYSYLPSWLSLLVEPAYGAETAEALFRTVWEHWRALPADARPHLYLHGMSLGALNSEQSADLWTVIGDPFRGALWAGPPFRSQTWRELVDQRAAGSPVWLPRVPDNSVVRFMNQHGMAAGRTAPAISDSEPPGASDWGPVRMLYLQYASDPITFIAPEILYRAPEWLEEPRGPDVSEKLRWFPVVTFLQLVADLAVADGAPTGYGHVYAPEHFVDAWVALTDPDDWSPSGLNRLKDHLATVK